MTNHHFVHSLCVFDVQTEGEEEKLRLRRSESISLAEDLYKKEEQVSYSVNCTLTNTNLLFR